MTRMTGRCLSDAQLGVKRWASREEWHGTCDQLYLVLRLASLENHLEGHEPMPL